MTFYALKYKNALDMSGIKYTHVVLKSGRFDEVVLMVEED